MIVVRRADELRACGDCRCRQPAIDAVFDARIGDIGRGKLAGPTCAIWMMCCAGAAHRRRRWREWQLRFRAASDLRSVKRRITGEADADLAHWWERFDRRRCCARSLRRGALSAVTRRAALQWPAGDAAAEGRRSRPRRGGQRSSAACRRKPADRARTNGGAGSPVADAGGDWVLSPRRAGAVIGLQANLRPDAGRMDAPASIAAVAARPLWLSGVSGRWCSRPVGQSSGPDYLNAVVRSETRLVYVASCPAALRAIERTACVAASAPGANAPRTPRLSTCC